MICLFNIISGHKEFVVFTARKRNWRRLCFHRCLSVNGGGRAWLGVACVAGRGDVRGRRDGHCSGRGTHPTGMHSCLFLCFFVLFFLEEK